jgi:Lipopolysaccharide-assembly
MPKFTRRRFLSFGALAPLVAAGCRNGCPTIFGYTFGTEHLYDTNIHTVFVHTFKNHAFQTTPYRGMETDITQAVVNEIGRVTPYTVTSNLAAADTELMGVIVSITKQNNNRTQQNTTRDGEIQVAVDVVWRDLRDGTILSTPTKPKPPGTPPIPGPHDPPPIPFDPNVPVVPPIPVPPDLVPARITVSGRYLQELGETNSSALARLEKDVAVQIVSMMEKKW